MRITNSRDGVKRTTVRVEWRLDRDQIRAALCSEYRLDDVEDLPASLSRTAIADKVRQTLWMGGSDRLDWWQDDLSEEEADAVQSWADEQIRAAFPEFD